MDYKKSIIVSLILGTLLFSCSNHSNEQNEININNSHERDSIGLMNDSILDSEETSFTLPSPLQIAYVFKKSGAPFVSSLLNDSKNITRYNTNNYKRAINFGIYSADLAYCIFNNKNQEAKKYLAACQNIGGYLGLNQAFDSDEITKRFNKYISNEDSLVKLVSNVQLKTDILLEQNKQKHIIATAFAGAWIESMFIASELYSKEKNNKVLASLFEQLSFSEILVKALKKYKTSEPEIPELIKTIEKINIQFNSINSIKTTLEKNQDIDFNEMHMTSDEFNTMAEMILSLRQNMTL